MKVSFRKNAKPDRVGQASAPFFRVPVEHVVHAAPEPPKKAALTPAVEHLAHLVAKPPK